MRLRNKILCLVLCFACPLCAGEWRLDSGGFDFDSAKGRGRIHGPVKLEFAEWVISCTREAFVSSEGRIFKISGEGGKSAGYRVENEMARIVFLSECRLTDANGVAVLEAPFLIFDLGKRSVTSTGSGITVRENAGLIRGMAETSVVSVDLDSGKIVLTGAGWKRGEG